MFMGVSILHSQTVVFSSGFEAWSGTTPDNWMGAKTNIPPANVVQYTTNVHGGSSAVQLINTNTTHARFTTQPMVLDSGTTYTINFWVRGQGNIRTGLFDDRPTGSGYATYNPYIQVNTATWISQSQDITCVKNTNIGEFILSVQSTVATGDHLQVDDVSITEPGLPVPTVTITSPVNGATVYSSSVSVVFTVSNFTVGNPGTGVDGHLHYYLDGGPAIMYYSTAPINASSLTPGNHQVVLQLVDNNHNPLVPNRADTVSFMVDQNPPHLKTIYQIQYTQDPSGNSPLADSVVSVYGTVTGKHGAGYFIQEAYGPWHGVYVYDNQNQPALGDSVFLTGTVAEYYNLTEIKLVTAFNILANGLPGPAPVTVTCSQVNMEDYEGVLVTVNNATCVNPSAGFGMWTIEDATDTAKVHNLMYTYSPVLNTIYDVTGPVYYSFNEFRVEPRTAADVVIVTGMNEQEGNTAVRIYPNPVHMELHLEGLTTEDELIITNLAGQTVLKTRLTGQADVTLDIRDLPAGTYLLTLTGAAGHTTIPLIKR